MSSLQVEDGGALLTDLYELTMAAAYFDHGVPGQAAFEMLIRDLPPSRSYLVCAGLEQLVSHLESLRFTSAQIDYLRSQPVFGHVSEEFWSYLSAFRFTGSVAAMPEGTVAFAGEPLVSVRAPIIEAQIIETFLLTTLNYQTLVATKAARVVGAATSDGRERAVVDFGSRRAHGPQAGVLAARAAYLGGCVATSNVEAGLRFGLPISGTQAHSFVMAFETEEEAFRAFYESFPDTCILLVDTYDVLQGVVKAARVAPGLRGVRIDSGDIAALSRQVREALGREGLGDAMIVASGDLDEWKIEELLHSGADVDAFGVGTALATSSDAPALGGVYKLVAVKRDGTWEPKIKLSSGKVTCPGLKQVYRALEPGTGGFAHDILAAVDEPAPPGAVPLLESVMEGGCRLAPPCKLEDVRARAARQLASLPERFKRLREPECYPVQVSRELTRRADLLAGQVQRGGP